MNSFEGVAGYSRHIDLGTSVGSEYAKVHNPRNQRLGRNGRHGWIELVEVCNLNVVAGGFVKVWTKCLEFMLKVLSADFFARPV